MTRSSLKTHPRARGRRGLSLIDAVMTLSIMASVSVIVLPAAAGMLDRARHARVQMELNAIAAGIVEYARDVGRYPGGENIHFRQRTERLVLISDGDYPGTGKSAAMKAWEDAPQVSLYSYLRAADDSAGSRWLGPYLPDNVEKDPWGQSYLVNISCAITSATSGEVKRAVYVLSAGPNGIIDTPFSQHASRAHIWGDDFAVRIQ